MADFRKMLFVLVALFAIMAMIPDTASAQTGVTCTAFVANQPIMRQEGATEPAGDILISCNGTLQGAQKNAQTLTLYVTNASITSRQLWTGTSAPSNVPTEAAVLVNDCTTNTGTSVTGFNCAPTSGGTFLGGNPTQGFLQNGALVFSGFTLPDNGQPFQIRVTNVRVNANQLSAGSFVTGTVLATFGISNQQNLVLGAVQSSLSLTVGSVSGFAQCNSTPTQGSVITTLSVKELVNSAFKAPAVTGAPGPPPTGNYLPGNWYQPGINTESQTVFSTPAGWSNQIAATPGLADSATRFRINFSNIPAGVTISVPVTVCQSATSCTGTNTNVAQATSSGDVGPFTIASGSNVTLTSSGSVTYQVITQQGSQIDTFQIPVTVTYTYTPPSTPNVGTILVSATYAPTTAEVTTPNPSFGEPRFADTSSLQSFITLSACQTDLLFTFLTNQAGFDTGFEISNTSTDPFGTSAQNGTCTLNWYGTGPAAGTATTTPSIASGSYYANLVSSAAPGFQGYMIAVCNFQFGHGFAFISDGYGQPGRGLSQGYLASIIPTPGLQNANGGTANVRNASDASLSAVKGSGEALNQ